MVPMSRWVGLAVVATVVCLVACGSDSDHKNPSGGGGQSAANSGGECKPTIALPDPQKEVLVSDIFNGRAGTFRFQHADVYVDNQLASGRHQFLAFSVSPTETGEYLTQVACFDQRQDNSFTLSQNGGFPREISRLNRRFGELIKAKVILSVPTENQNPVTSAEIVNYPDTLDNFIKKGFKGKAHFYNQPDGGFEMLGSFTLADDHGDGQSQVTVSIYYTFIP